MSKHTFIRKSIVLTKKSFLYFSFIKRYQGRFVCVCISKLETVCSSSMIDQKTSAKTSTHILLNNLAKHS